MDQHQILATMDSVQIGQDAAENEPDLYNIFVTATDTYRKLIRDEIDVIIGGKGSGKSAIYRMVTETQLDPRLMVIPAVNPTGSPVFRDLFKANSSEARLISIWTAYSVGLIGNYIIDEFSDDAPTRFLVEKLTDTFIGLGLRQPAQERRMTLLERIRSARGVEVGASAAGVGASLKFDLDGDATSGSIVVLPVDFLGLLRDCREILELQDRRVWVAFDRLDECFERHTLIEGRALRALLRTHLNTHPELDFGGTIRLKIFLRSDLMAQMTKTETFTNSTHLRKDVLRWNTNGIAHIIAKRVVRSEEFNRHYGDRLRDDPVLGVWSALLPTLKCDYGTRYPTAHVLCRQTADVKGDVTEFSPRNVISLLTFALARARDNQRRALEVDSASRSTSPLIQAGELQSANGDVSRQRLQDTVINEFPRVSKYVRQLTGGSSSFSSKAELIRALGLESEKQSLAEETIDQMLLSGVLYAKGASYGIPTLYRAALKTRSNRRNRRNS